MKNEKVILISVFSLSFLLLAVLFFIMISYDLKKNKVNNDNENYLRDTREENVWPKVEINVRQ